MRPPRQLDELVPFLEEHPCVLTTDIDGSRVTSAFAGTQEGGIWIKRGEGQPLYLPGAIDGGRFELDDAGFTSRIGERTIRVDYLGLAPKD